MTLWRRLLLAVFTVIMVAIGGVRAVGGAFLMSAWRAHAALVDGQARSDDIARAARRANLSTLWWPFDARAWDAVGIFRLAAASSGNGFVGPADADIAVSAFRQATRRAPGQPTFWMRRAAAELAAGDRSNAVKSLRTSIVAGAYHPQALLFRVQLGLQLWPDLSTAMRAMIADQAVGALRLKNARPAARLLRGAPRELLSDVLMRLTPEERARLINQMRTI